jgi:hypothetical protein
MEPPTLDGPVTRAFRRRGPRSGRMEPKGLNGREASRPPCPRRVDTATLSEIRSDGVIWWSWRLPLFGLPEYFDAFWTCAAYSLGLPVGDPSRRRPLHLGLQQHGPERPGRDRLALFYAQPHR